MTVETRTEKLYYGVQEKAKKPACAELNSKGSAVLDFTAIAGACLVPKHIVTGRLLGVRSVRGGGPDLAG
jgi:hypothetical protein